jgi:hypothetical protein
MLTGSCGWWGQQATGENPPKKTRQRFMDMATRTQREKPTSLHAKALAASDQLESC